MLAEATSELDATGDRLAQAVIRLTDASVAEACHLPDAAAVDALYEQLTEAGHHGELAPFDAPWGQRYASVNDPDGNGVDLYAPL